MKLITAVVQSHRVDLVAQALEEVGVPGITVSQVEGAGNQNGYTEVYRGASHRVKRLPRSRIEVVTGDERADLVVSTIAAAAATGKVGDGKIWVTPVERVLRIRTGEEDTQALA